MRHFGILCSILALATSAYAEEPAAKAPEAVVKAPETAATPEAASPADAPKEAESPAKTDAPKSDLPDVVVAIDRITLVQLDDLLSSEGFSVKEAADGAENALEWKIEGYKADILLGNQQQVLQVHSCFDAKSSYEKMNLWNRENLFTHAFLNESHQPCIEMELDLNRGVTTLRVIDFFKMARSAVLHFQEDLGRK